MDGHPYFWKVWSTLRFNVIPNYDFTSIFQVSSMSSDSQFFKKSVLSVIHVSRIHFWAQSNRNYKMLMMAQESGSDLVRSRQMFAPTFKGSWKIFPWELKERQEWADEQEQAEEMAHGPLGGFATLTCQSKSWCIEQNKCVWTRFL